MMKNKTNKEQIFREEIFWEPIEKYITVLKLNSSLDSRLRIIIRSIGKFKIIFYSPNKHQITKLNKIFLYFQSVITREDDYDDDPRKSLFRFGTNGRTLECADSDFPTHTNQNKCFPRKYS